MAKSQSTQKQKSSQAATSAQTGKKRNAPSQSAQEPVSTRAIAKRKRPPNDSDPDVRTRAKTKPSQKKGRKAQESDVNIECVSMEEDNGTSDIEEVDGDEDEDRSRKGNNDDTVSVDIIPEPSMTTHVL